LRAAGHFRCGHSFVEQIGASVRVSPTRQYRSDEEEGITRHRVERTMHAMKYTRMSRVAGIAGTSAHGSYRRSTIQVAHEHAGDARKHVAILAVGLKDRNRRVRRQQQPSR